MKKNRAEKEVEEKIQNEFKCLKEIRSRFFDGHHVFRQVDTKSQICKQIRTVEKVDSTIHDPQQEAADELFEKLSKVITFNDKTQVNCYFLLPNKISLEKQTESRLKKFIEAMKMNSKVPVPEDLMIRCKKMELVKDFVREMNIKRAANPDAVFLFFQDECHWGAGKGSVSSVFTEEVLSIEGSFLIGVSATPNNQLKVLYDKPEWGGLKEKTVELKSPDYVGMQQFIARDKIISTKRPATKLIIPMSYLCCIASHDFDGQSSVKKISYDQIKFNESQLDTQEKITKQVIDQLFKGGLVVLALSGTRIAETFAESFASILDERFPKNDILVCYSVSTEKKEFIKSLNCNCTSMDFSNVLHNHKACLLVVVGRARFGDTFTGDFKYLDLRDKFRSSITWTPFYQMCGRAFGYGERPTLLLNNKAKKAFLNEGRSDIIPDIFLKKIKEKKSSNKSPNKSPNRSPKSKKKSSDYLVDFTNPILEYSNEKLEVVKEQIKKSCANFFIITNKSDVGKLDKYDGYDLYLYGNNQQVYRVQKDGIFEDPVSLEDALQFDLELVNDVVQLNYLRISNNHAANNSRFVDTFSKRMYLVAEPQMGKTGVMLALFKKIADASIINCTPPGYPKISSIAEQCEQMKQAGTQSFTFPNYGKISFFDEDKLPEYYNRGNSGKRTTIVQRIDKMKYASVNVINDLYSNEIWNEHEFFFEFFSIKDDSIRCSSELEGVDWKSKKAPFMFISHGRSDPKIPFEDKSKERNQIIVTTICGLSNYKKFKDSHSFIVVNVQNPSSGYLRNCAIYFAKENGIQNIWLLDDDLDNSVEFRSINSIPEDHWIRDKETITLSDVVNYLEDENWRDRSCYAICSPGEKNQKFDFKNAFSCESRTGMSLVNVDQVGEYLPSIEIADLEVAFHMIMKDKLVCRFEIFGVSKIHTNEGCFRNTDELETFPNNPDPMDGRAFKIKLFDKLLPKCPENTTIKPIIAMCTPKTKYSQKGILNERRDLHFFNNKSPKDICESIKKCKNLAFCGAFIETKHFFRGLIFLNLILYKDRGEQDLDKTVLKNFLAGEFEDLIMKKPKLKKLEIEKDNFSFANLFQSVSINL